MEAAAPTDQMKDEPQRREWLISQIANTLPGVGRERVPGLGGDADWPDAVALGDHPVYGDAFNDSRFQAALSVAAQSPGANVGELQATALEVRREFLSSALISRKGKAGLSPILTHEIWRVLAEDLADLGLLDPVESRRHLHRLAECADEAWNHGCIPGTGELLTLRKAFEGVEPPDRRGWRFEDLVREYVERHPETVRGENYTERRTEKARSLPASLEADRDIEMKEDSHPRRPVAEAIDLASRALELRLVPRRRDADRLVALVRHGCYRKAAREVRENPGSFHQAIARTLKQVRTRASKMLILRFAMLAAESEADVRAIALVAARDVDMKTPAEVAQEFHYATRRSASSALTIARKRVRELAVRACNLGLSPEDLAFPSR